MKQFWESAKKIEKNVKKQYMLDMYNMPKIETMNDVFAVLNTLGRQEMASR